MTDIIAGDALARAASQVGVSILPQGMCLNFVWRMYGSNQSVGDAVGHLDTAWNAWQVVKGKHLGDRNVPAGYFAMLGPSPTRTDKNKNAGDIIISRGDGTFICTDASGSRVGVMTLAAREKQTQRPFVGWGEDLGNHPIIGAANPPAHINPLIGDDEMILIEHKDRGQAVIGAGYHHAVNAEESGSGLDKITDRHIVCDSARQFDLYVSVATIGRNEVSNSAN
jgi:hypothetical protein